MFPDLKQAGKKPVPNASTESGPGTYVPECSGWEISQISWGKIWFPGNGIQERRPLAIGKNNQVSKEQIS